jgi:hypothetical protein
MRIVVPKQLNVVNAAEVVRAIQRRVRIAEMEIDFSGINFVYPTGTVFLAISLRRLLEERKQHGLNTRLLLDVRRSQGCGYLSAFGFFDAIGQPHENAALPAAEHQRYLTLTTIKREQVSFEGVPVQEKLEQLSLKLAQMLMRESVADAPIVQAIGYAMRESIRNVFEHAVTNEAIVMAQSWVNGRAEFALGDNGIGIYESLSRAYKLKGHADALKMAILPGITEYKGPETRDVWQNSGYGLYMLSEVAKKFGRLDLASSGQILTVNPSRINIAPTFVPSGTIVGLRVDVPEDIYWSNFLEASRIRGEAQAKRIPGARHAASASAGGLWM